jgi:succinoglycan biosynthesis protein ExoA
LVEVTSPLDPLPSLELGLRESVRPDVSIVIPTLQEEDAIRECLDSLLEQDYENIRELLVVDGGSLDRTREIVGGYSVGVRLVDNPNVTAASAMNIGIEEASSDVIVRIDAHSRYERDYVTRSVEALLTSGAAVAGGPMRPVGRTQFGNAVALVTTSPLGVGPGRFHYSDTAEFVDTVYLGTFFAVDIMAVGGYDTESLQWAAEDQELNYRIRRAGGRIWLDPRIKSTYEPRSTPRALARQYRNYGLAKASTLKKHRTLPTWRPLAPAGMVSAFILGAVAGLLLRQFWLAVVFPLSYFLLALLASLWLSRRSPKMLGRTLCALTICHLAYGVGFLQGLGRIALRRPFEVRPRSRKRV